MSEFQGTWSEVEIAGHPCDVYDPPQCNEHHYVVMFLHGVHLGRLTDKAAFCRELDRYRLPVIAPLTQRSWWTDKICPEFDPHISAERHLLDNVLPYLAQRWQCRPPRIALLGASMGGQGVLRLAFKYPHLFPIVAAIAPAIDFHLRFYEEHEETIPTMYPDPEAARQDTATLYLRPLSWPRHTWFASDPADARWHDCAQRLKMKFDALGALYQADLETSAGGHGWQYYNHMAPAAMAFIAESLEQERLRIV